MSGAADQQEKRTIVKKTQNVPTIKIMHERLEKQPLSYVKMVTKSTPTHAS